MGTQRQGRWTSGAFMMYVRAIGEQEDTVSRFIASNTMAGGIQPRQGTEWGGSGAKNNY